MVNPQQMGAITRKLNALSSQIESDLEKVRNNKYTQSEVADLTDDYQEQLEEILEDAQARHGEFRPNHVSICTDIIELLGDMVYEVSHRNWAQRLINRLQSIKDRFSKLNDFFNDN